MEISGFWQVFLCASFGSALMEVLKWHNLRESPNLPVYARSPLYWSLTILMIVCAGGLAVLYGITPRNAIMVLNIGLSAPLIIKTLADNGAGDLTGTKANGKRSPKGKLKDPSIPSPPQPPGYRQDAPVEDTAEHLRPASVVDFLRWR